MKRTIMTLAAAAIAAAGTVQAQATPDTRPGLAVLPFTNSAIQPEYATLTKGFQGVLTAELANNPRIRVVERENLQRILDEQRLGASGQLDPSAMVRVGKIVGARYMIYGTYITNSRRELQVVLTAFDTETSEIVFSDNSTRGKLDDLMDLIAKASGVASTKLNLPQLQPGSSEAREAAAKTEQVKKMPLNAVVLYSRALEAQDAGKTAEAITLYKQVVEKFPYPPAEAALVKLGAK
jgi:TolB-like protein